MPTKTTKTTKVTKTTKPVKATKTMPKKAVAKPSGLSLPVMGVDGAKAGTIRLSVEVFGVNINKQLLAQAVRVYLANQRVGGAATKTRGMVEGSTRKIYRQKGTGKARHGSIRAPIFVGGGIVFGPVPKDFSRLMPAKMRKAALVSALTTQHNEGKIAVIDGLEGLAKTKLVAQALTANTVTGSTLLVVPTDGQGIVRIARNISSVDVLPVNLLNTYDVLMHAKVVFTKKALESI